MATSGGSKLCVDVEMEVQEKVNGFIAATIGGIETHFDSAKSRVIFRMKLESECCHNCWRHDVHLHNDIVRGDLAVAEVALRCQLCDKLRRHQEDKQSPGDCSLVWDPFQTFPTWALRDKMRSVSSALAEEE